MFANARPVIDFKGVDLRSRIIDGPGFALKDANNDSTVDLREFGTANQVVIKPPSNDVPGAFAQPYRMNQFYNIHWKDGIDFEHMSIAPTPYF